MKITALILSIFFLLIAVQPVLAGLSKMSASCHASAVAQHDNCSSSQHDKTKNKENQNKRDESKCPICNCTIYQCAFCTGTIVEENTFGISRFSESANNYLKADSNLHSSYSSDCWQPPELI